MKPINNTQLPALPVPLWAHGDRLSLEGLNRPVEALNKLLGQPRPPQDAFERLTHVQISIDIYTASTSIVLAGIPAGYVSGIILEGGELCFVDRADDRGFYVVGSGQWPLLYDPLNLEVGWAFLITRGDYRGALWHVVEGSELEEFTPTS